MPHQPQQSQQTPHPQQLVRVLTANGMIQGIAPAYIAMANNQQLNIQQLQQQTSQAVKPQQQPLQQQPQSMVGATIGSPSPGIAPATSPIEQLPPPKRKPKKKKKNKEPKLDLANIMKLSGIGDDDDVHFESDASESAHSETQTNQQQLGKKTDAAVLTSTAPDIQTSLHQVPKRIGKFG